VPVAPARRPLPRPLLPVLGPSGTALRLARAYDLPEEPGMSAEFRFGGYPPGPFEIGPFTVQVARVVHPVEAYGLRLEHGGRVLAYSGDTAPTDALVGLARDADVLVAEATFVDGEPHPPGLHLTGREAAEHAARAGVDRLVLTHVPPWNDPLRTLADAAAVDGVRCALATTGLVVEV
jgi:ribonuclease BN (tRNA processing enzyme)